MHILHCHADKPGYSVHEAKDYKKEAKSMICGTPAATVLELAPSPICKIPIWVLVEPKVWRKGAVTSSSSSSSSSSSNDDDDDIPKEFSPHMKFVKWEDDDESEICVFLAYDGSNTLFHAEDERIYNISYYDPSPPTSPATSPTIPSTRGTSTTSAPAPASAPAAAPAAAPAPAPAAAPAPAPAAAAAAAAAPAPAPTPTEPAPSTSPSTSTTVVKIPVKTMQFKELVLQGKNDLKSMRGGVVRDRTSRV